MVAKTAAVSARLVRSSPTHRIYDVSVAGHTTVTTTVTDNPGVVRRWVYKTRWLEAHRLHSGAGLTVGMGVQWTPSFIRLGDGANPRPRTLQLCCGRRCLVFQIARVHSADPAVLQRFMYDARVAVVAYNVRADCDKLRDYHGLEVRNPRELRAVTGMGNASMERMVEQFLGWRGVKKHKRVGTSRWDARRLSKNQVVYASVDACISHCIGVRLGVTPGTDDEYTDSGSESDA